MTTTPNDPQHSLTLDVLRAVAALMVFAYHCHTELFPHSSSPLLPTITLGSTGVILFYVLSGLVIAGSLVRGAKIESGTAALRSFWIKRFFRIYPLYIFSCLAVLVLNDQIRNSLTTENLLYHIFGLHCLIRDYHGAINGVLWTLSLEIQFYLLAPLCFLIINKIGAGRFLTLIILLWTICYGLIRFYLIETLNFWGGASGPDFWSYFIGLNQIPSCLMFFALGMYAYYKPIRFKSLLIPILSVASVLVLPYIPFSAILPEKYFDAYAINYFRQGLYGLCFYIWVLYAYGITRMPGLFTKLMIWIGGLSYSFYIWHLLILRIIAPNFPTMGPWLKLTIALIATLILSDFTARHIERLGISLGKHFLRRLPKSPKSER